MMLYPLFSVRWRAATAGLVLLGLMAACSSTSDPESSAPQHALTVTHSQGETTLPAVPERIVALSTSWADTVLAFDIDPIAVGVLTGYAPADGTFPWQGDYQPTPIALSLLGDPDFEAIAATSPDLILADFSARNSAVYDRLSQIAPTIAPLSDSGYVDPWRDQVDILGQILDRPADADALVAAADTELVETRTSFPCVQGASFLLATLSPDTVGVVADPCDPAAELFGELGMELLPDVVELAEGKTRLTVSYEQSAALAQADLTLIRERGGRALPSPSGHTVTLDGPLATALSDPSVQNVGYITETLTPALAALCTTA
jgi:iron complex transport system substrate-binding protein